MFRQNAPRVGGMARVRAVVPEAPHAVRQRLIQKWRLLERRGRRGFTRRAGGLGQEREMREPDSATFDRSLALHEPATLLTRGDGSICRRARHMAFMPYPIRGAGRTLTFVLVA